MFDWDDHNVAHIARHGLETKDVESVLQRATTAFVPAYAVGGEMLWAAVGLDGQRRTLFVVFTIRGPMVRVITARPASRLERRRISGS